MKQITFHTSSQGVQQGKGRFQMEREKQGTKSVVDQVVDGVISEIIEGRLAPGSKLPTEI